MKIKNSIKFAKELAEAWEHAAERAAEKQSCIQELGEELDDAAGLHVRAGLKAGAWSHDCSTSCNHRTCVC
ncbi:MAG TPA: hypothetical protein VFD70_10810 [Anaerolineae bacterium]|nr:hypothetical protein [Anaerolineae bacterium]